MLAASGALFPGPYVWRIIFDEGVILGAIGYGAERLFCVVNSRNG